MKGREREHDVLSRQFYPKRNGARISSVDETSMKSATANWIEIKNSIDSWPVDVKLFNCLAIKTGNLMGSNGGISYHRDIMGLNLVFSKFPACVVCPVKIKDLVLTFSYTPILETACHGMTRNYKPTNMTSANEDMSKRKNQVANLRSS